MSFVLYGDSFALHQSRKLAPSSKLLVVVMGEALKRLIASLLEGLGFHMDGLRGGQTTVDDWQAGVAQDLLVHHYAAYMEASGSETVPANARARLNAIVAQQVDRLNGFADSLDGRDVTDADAARLNLYAEALKASYSMGSTGNPDLPAYPGDGSTPCIGHCGCSWEEKSGKWYWTRGKADSCAECVRRASAWAPYKG
jgi:hypothetical protein